MSRPIRLLEILVYLLVSTSLAGCEFNLNSTHNSSEGDNDYFEESIKEPSIKYRAALETSNRFVEIFSRGEIPMSYELLNDALRKTLSVQDLESVYGEMMGALGPIVEFKPMQWGFSKRMIDGEDVLISTKIVIHKNGGAFYFVIFLDDGVFRRIAGFNIQQRVGNERVVAGISRVFDGA